MLRFYCLVLLFSSGALSATAQIYYNPFGTAPAGTNDQLTVRPGSVLHLQTENINPLKYKVAVTSAYFTQEFSSVPASTAPPSAAAASPAGGAPSGGGVGTSALAEKALVAQAAADRFTAIRAHYSAYNKVVGEVNKLYAADIWPANVASTFMTEAATAFDGRENVITAGEFVSRLSLWHTQLLSAIEEYNTQTTAFAAEIATQQAALPEATTELNQAQLAFDNEVV